MNSEFSHTFPAIRGTQAGRPCYIAMCPMRIVPKLFKFDEEEVLAFKGNLEEDLINLGFSNFAFDDHAHAFYDGGEVTEFTFLFLAYTLYPYD